MISLVSPRGIGERARKFCADHPPFHRVARLSFDRFPVEPAMEDTMLKVSLAAAFLSVMCLSPAYTQDLCNDAHMKQMDKMIAEMTDAAKQKEATAALDQSKAAMQKGDTAGCMKYMDAAHKAMGL
jgi:hypothetical protein